MADDIAIGYNVDALAQMVRAAYRRGEPYQWAREAYINCVEAGSTDIFFGIDKQGLEQSGTARRYIVDNGSGMKPDELLSFMSTFGGSGKTIGDTDNFGIGFKASTYEWNKYGIIVASWTAGDPDGAMIWIRYDAERDRWVRRVWDMDDDTIDQLIVPDVVEVGTDLIDIRELRTESLIAVGHGTVILLLGNGPEMSTDLGDPDRGETALRGAVKYLNSRLLEVPANVTCKVVALESPHKDDSKDKVVMLPDGSKQVLHPRNVYGLRNFIGTGKKTRKGHVIVDGPQDSKVGIEWFYGETSKDAQISDSSYGPGPRIVYRYDKVLPHGIVLSEAYTSYTAAHESHHYKHYGLTPKQSQFWLIVHLPQYDNLDPGKWGVYPEDARSRLIGKGGVPSFDRIVAAVADEFWKAAPEVRALMQTVSKSASSAAKDRAERIRRVLGKYGKRFGWNFPVIEKKGGDVGGTADGTVPHIPRPSKPKVPVGPHHPGSGSGGMGGDGPNTVTPGAGPAVGTPVRRAVGAPEIEWVNRDEFVGILGEDVEGAAGFGAQWCDKRGEYGTIVLNRDFPVFTTQVRYWTDYFPKLPAQTVTETVLGKYEDNIAATVSHIAGSSGRVFDVNAPAAGKWSTPLLGSMLTHQALTASLFGLQNVEAAIRTTLGSVGGAGDPAAAMAALESGAAA